MPSIPCGSCGKYITVKPRSVLEHRPNLCSACYRPQLESGHFRCKATNRHGKRCSLPTKPGHELRVAHFRECRDRCKAAYDKHLARLGNPGGGDDHEDWDAPLSTPDSPRAGRAVAKIAPELHFRCSRLAE